jgi:[CysO sulfur-carrier protein]-S-L-cysteine hydrolase
MSKERSTTINAELMAALVPWLESAYPEEGCGLVLRAGDDGLRFLECENVIDRYHELDPQAYPRTARDFYMIDPREFVKAEDRGESVVAVVHSHPDTGDYFSDSDVEAALMPRDTEEDPVEPIYPGADYLVVSVCDGRAKEASLYRFDERALEFIRAEKWDGRRLKDAINRRAAQPETAS